MGNICIDTEHLRTFKPVQASTWTDPSPYIEFNEPGIFEVSVQVTVEMVQFCISQEIVVEGPPSVDINVNGPDSDQIYY